MLYIKVTEKFKIENDGKYKDPIELQFLATLSGEWVCPLVVAEQFPELFEGNFDIINLNQTDFKINGNL